jgi:Histidine kinase-, DNA gyrase B-, and HSP90-like ATPase
MKELKPHIGKNVIETLTLGMYDDARFIYREYVQNAADQIDVAVEEQILKNKAEGLIDITIEKESKTIIIEDNATGIKDENVLQFLGDVANSQKDKEKRKGFRGIGRLGGLGYCEKLIFETSYFGEQTKNTITLNAKQLKQILENKADTSDASTVISIITKLNISESRSEDHYFKVTLENVTNEILLNSGSVSSYLSLVAPIPYNPEFEFRHKIYNYYKSNKIAIDEYDVHLSINDVKLFKPYKSLFYKNEKVFSQLLDVVCYTVANVEEEIIAIGWYGITNKLNHQIPEENIEGGIRLRKENIGIGDRLTLSNYFGQPRQNLNYIGEIHAIGSGFTPNARRDNFNDSRTYSFLEDKLTQLFSYLGSLTQDSSKLHNRKKDINTYKEEVTKFEQESSSGELTERQVESRREDLIKVRNSAIKAVKEINKLKVKSTSDTKLSIVYDTIIDNLDITIDDEEIDLDLNMQTYSITLTQLNLVEKELVKDIFSIIDENLSLEMAEMIKKKIAEKYN